MNKTGQPSLILAGRSSLPLYAAFFPVMAWAGNFVILRLALRFYEPLALTAVRFLVIGLTVVYFGWPKLKLRVIASYAVLSAGGQYTLSTLAIYLGLSAGLASLVMQAQVFIAALLGFVVLKERPFWGTLVGALFGFGGLVLLTLARGQTFSVSGFLVCLIAAACWAGSSLQLRVIQWKGLFSLQAASCLLALPFVSALSWKLETEPFHRDAFVNHPTYAIGSILYMSLVSLFAAQTVWGRLLSERPVTTVAPFALLIPVFGIALSYVFLGERLFPVQVVSCALVLVGLILHFVSVWRRGHHG
ncbi:EamA family transporter [Trinickia mobilis]|uniref:EamA family transporter n=1 Tax=Trinickia mobilis TaxID=2816356 RepID=UPI001A8EA743|nr:EamA family transporter [Trinickia mobilis]